MVYECDPCSTVAAIMCIGRPLGCVRNTITPVWCAMQQTAAHTPAHLVASHQGKLGQAAAPSWQRVDRRLTSVGWVPVTIIPPGRHWCNATTVDQEALAVTDMMQLPQHDCCACFTKSARQWKWQFAHPGLQVPKAGLPFPQAGAAVFGKAGASALHAPQLATSVPFRFTSQPFAEFLSQSANLRPHRESCS
jgi:hypothetical protein